MNREQRRKVMKQRLNIVDIRSRADNEARKLGVIPEAENPDFSRVPLATVCQSINVLIDELRGRGISVYDFDNKDKAVMGVQIVRGKVYFMAVREESKNEGI